MEKSFEITFEFPLVHSNRTIGTRADATLHHSEPYYVIDNFYFEGHDASGNELCLLPTQEIMRQKKGEGYTWVHRETRRESVLSHVIGKAIDNLKGKGRD